MLVTQDNIIQHNSQNNLKYIYRLMQWDELIKLIAGEVIDDDYDEYETTRVGVSFSISKKACYEYGKRKNPFNFNDGNLPRFKSGEKDQIYLLTFDYNILSQHFEFKQFGDYSLDYFKNNLDAFFHFITADGWEMAWETLEFWVTEGIDYRGDPRPKEVLDAIDPGYKKFNQANKWFNKEFGEDFDEPTIEDAYKLARYLLDIEYPYLIDAMNFCKDEQEILLIGTYYFIPGMIVNIESIIPEGLNLLSNFILENKDKLNLQL